MWIRHRLVPSFVLAGGLATFVGCAASAPPATTPATSTLPSGALNAPPAFIIIPAIPTSAPTPNITVVATAPPIVLYQAQRSFPFGASVQVQTIARPGTFAALPVVTSYVAHDPQIVTVATSDSSSVPPLALPAGVAKLVLVGYGRTSLDALSGSGVVASTIVLTYRTANISCDILGVNGLTFAADGSATAATSPASADVYFTAPVPQPGAGACTNPAFASAATSPLTFPYGATVVPLANLAAFAELTPAAYRNDFTILANPQAGGAYAIVFRAASGATVKYTSPGLYEAASAGATAFPY